MSDTTGPVANPDQNPVTEPLQLADQAPLEPVAEPQEQKKNHTRTILEVVGAAVAGILILAAAGFGFAIGHATSGDDRGFDRGGMNLADGQGRQGQQGFGQQGQGQQGFGQQGQGMDPRGIDPDGDNWTGGGMMGGDQGFGQQGQPLVPNQQGTVPTTPSPSGGA